MKRYHIILILFAVFSSSGYSQTEHETAWEQKASELVKKASEKIKDYRSMEVEFTYTMENSQMDITETMSGKVYTKGDKYRMLLGDNVFISDGKTVWNFIDDLWEIHINRLENMEGGLTPTALLDNFETEYRGKFIRQENHKGRMVDLIDMIPVTPQSFFKYRLAIDATNQTLVYTIAYDRHGGTYTYSIDTLKPNINIDDSMFVFNRADFPESIDIIDLR